MTNEKLFNVEMATIIKKIMALHEPGSKITIIVRQPSGNEQDLIDTCDSPEEIIAAIQRRIELVDRLNPNKRYFLTAALAVDGSRKAATDNGRGLEPGQLGLQNSPGGNVGESGSPDTPNASRPSTAKATQ